MGSTQAADAGDGEATALHFARSQLTVTRFLRNSHQLARQLDDAFLVDVFEYRNNQTVRGIHRHTDVDVFLQGQTLTVFRQRTIEARHLLKSCSNGFHDEDNRGELHIQLTFRRFFVLLFTERFQLGDIGFVEVGNMRDHHPVTAQVSTRNFLDTAQFHFFDFAKLAEVHLRPRQHARDTTASRRRSCFCTFDSFFHVSLNVFAQDTTFTTSALHFRQVNAKLACQTADQRSRVNVSVVFSKFRFAFGFRSRSCCRGFSFRCRSRRCRFLFRRSCRRRCAFNFEDHNQRASFHFIANVDFQFLHDACKRSRDLHRSFIAFYGDKRLFSGNFVAHFHHHFGHFNFVTADIRNVNFFHASR
ncbi:Uncharacterised protein [Shigella sonnei]|nr:Uncharacterised protein [Shigella sonnei]